MLLGASLFALGDPAVAGLAGEPETELLILIVWDRCLLSRLSIKLDLSVAVDPELLYVLILRRSNWVRFAKLFKAYTA